MRATFQPHWVQAQEGHASFPIPPPPLSLTSFMLHSHIPPPHCLFLSLSLFQSPELHSAVHGGRRDCGGVAVEGHRRDLLAVTRQRGDGGPVLHSLHHHIPGGAPNPEEGPREVKLHRTAALSPGQRQSAEVGELAEVPELHFPAGGVGRGHHVVAVFAEVDGRHVVAAVAVGERVDHGLRLHVPHFRVAAAPAQPEQQTVRVEASAVVRRAAARPARVKARGVRQARKGPAPVLARHRRVLPGGVHRQARALRLEPANRRVANRGAAAEGPNLHRFVRARGQDLVAAVLVEKRSGDLLGVPRQSRLHLLLAVVVHPSRRVYAARHRDEALGRAALGWHALHVEAGDAAGFG
mmetsp:Transcript_67046/g.131502  ORF Transcript_67046/g.131502 Transcript_67046/m.131502 type:complete len:352 (-) Transcript_67046:692-1747(-)